MAPASLKQWTSKTENDDAIHIPSESVLNTDFLIYIAQTNSNCFVELIYEKKDELIFVAGFTIISSITNAGLF